MVSPSSLKKGCKDGFTIHSSPPPPSLGPSSYPLMRKKSPNWLSRSENWDDEPLSARQISYLNLPETEFGEMLAAVIEFENEHPAGSFPGFIRLPDVAVCGRVVAQNAGKNIAIESRRVAKIG